MSKLKDMIPDPGTAHEPDALTDKELDAAVGGSPVLFQYCATGRHLPAQSSIDISEMQQMDINRQLRRL
jgi:hypothetical protein